MRLIIIPYSICALHNILMIININDSIERTSKRLIYHLCSHTFFILIIIRGIKRTEYGKQKLYLCARHL